MEREPEQELPQIAAENRAFRQILLLTVLAFLSVAGVYLVLSGPARYLVIGAIGRLPAVIGFYSSEAAEHNRLVLAYGDSIGMSGFDAYTFEKLAGDQGISAFNLARSAASNAELLYDLSEPPMQRALVLLYVNPLTLAGTRHNNIHPNKADLYSVYGPGPDPSLFAEFEARVPGADLSYALEPRWQHVLNSRWRFETALRHPVQSLPLFTRDTRARGRDLQRSCTDLKYPNWDKAVGRKELEREITYDLNQLGQTFHYEPGSYEALHFLLEKLEARSRGVVMVMSPVNPLTQERLPSGYIGEYREAVEELAGGKVRVVDLTNLLSASDFRDAHHYNLAGGSRLTAELYRQLVAGGI